MHRAYSLDWSPNALSPTSQKNALEKNLKKVAELTDELNNEIFEKNDLLEENTSLKADVENLNKKLKLKTQETEKLKNDYADLQLTIEKASKESSCNHTSENLIIINDLKSEIIEYKKYVTILENENESMKRAVERCEREYSKITHDYLILEKEHEELRSNFSDNLLKIEELQKTCDFMKIELSDLKECNQVLKEENVILETKKSTYTENSDCLQRELQFQFMKDEIVLMNSNLKTVEEKQMKLISANIELNKEKTELEKLQLEISKDNEEAKLQNEKLCEKINILTKENESLKNLADGLDAKLVDTEKLLHDHEQRLEILTSDYKETEKKLINEKEEMLQKYNELTKNNCQLILQLDAMINEKENYQIALQENKTKLEAKKVEYEVLMNKQTELNLERDNLKHTLLKFESELNLLQLLKEKTDEELILKTDMIDKLQSSEANLKKRCQTINSENETLEKSLKNVNTELITIKKEKTDLAVHSEKLNCDYKKMVQSHNVLLQCKEDLMEKMSFLTNTIDDLKTRLEKVTSELTNVVSERDILVSEYEELKENNSKLIESLRNEILKTKSEKETLFRCNQENCNKVQDLQLQIQNLACSKNLLTKELQDNETKYENSIQNLNKKLDATSLERNTIFAKNEDLQQENYKLQSYVSEISSEKDSLLRHTEVLKKNIDELLLSKNSLSDELKKAEESRIKSIDELQKQLKALLLELESSTDKNNVLEEETRSLHSEIASMTKENTTLQEKLREFIELESVLSEKSRKQTITIEELQEKVENLSVLNEKLSDEFRNFKDARAIEFANLQKELTNIIGERDTFAVNCSCLAEEYSELQNRVVKFSDQNELLQQQLELSEKTSKSLSEKNDELLKTIQEVKERAEVLNASNVTLSKELEKNDVGFGEKIRELQKNLDSALSEYEEQLRNNELLTNENLSLSNCKADIMKQNENLQEQLERFEKDQHILSQKNSEYLQKIHELEDEILEVVKNKENTLETLGKTEREFHEKIDLLQKKLDATLLDYELQCENKNRLSEENIILQSRIAEIILKEQSLQKQLENLGSETEKQFHEKIDLLQKKLDAALLDSELQSENKNRLSDENMLLESRIAEILLKEQSLQKQLEDLASEKSLTDNRICEYEKVVEKLKHEIEELTLSRNSLSQEMLEVVNTNAEKICSLNEQLDSLMLEKKVYEEKNFNLVEKNKELQTSITQLQEQDKLRLEQVEKYEAEKIIFLENNTKQINIIQDFEKEIQNLSSLNNSLADDLRLNNIKYTEKINKLEEEFKLVTEERDRLYEKNSQLIKENSIINNRLSVLQKENEETQQQLKELTEEKTNSLNDLREMLLHQIDQLQKANNEMKEENHQLTEKNAEKLLCLKEVEKRFELLTNDMKELSLKAEKLEMINDQLKDKVEECKESEINLKNENTNLKELINNSESGKEGLLKQIEVLQNKEKVLSKTVQDLTKEIEDAKLDKKELRKVISVESQTNDSLKKINADLMKKINDLEAERNKFQNEVNELSHRVDSTKEECQLDFQKLLQENVKIKTRLEEITVEKEELYRMEKINKDVFENQLQTYTSKNQNLQNEIEKLHDSIEKMNADMITLKEKIRHSECIIDNLRCSNEKEKFDLTAALDTEQLRNSEINTRLESIIKENQNITEQLEAEKQRSQNLMSSYESALQKEIELKKSLECKIQSIESCEIESLKKRIEELKTKLEEVLEANECLTERTKSRTNQQELLIQENENLIHKLSQLEKHKMNVEKEYDLLMEDKEELRKLNEGMLLQINNLKEIVEGKDKDNIRLREEYDVFKQEYHKLVQHKGELDKEFKETLLQDNAKLSKKCDELSDANMKFMDQLTEKGKLIESLREEVSKFKERNSHPVEKADLNETRVVASGSENEIYMNLRQDNIKLVEERDNYKKQLAEISHLLEKEKEAYRNKAQTLYNKISTKMIAEYEGKLERAKAEYQKIMKQKYSMQESDWKKREEEYKLMLKKEKEHIRDLSSQMWDISDKYLQLKQKLETKNSPLKFRTYSEETLFSPSTISRRTKSATQLNLIGGKGYRISDFDRRLSTMSEDMPPQMRRRQTLTISGKKFSLSSAKVFPTEDEEQEIFDNACLADLKQGRVCIDDSNDFSKQRLSILQQRNSLCPPHLKSSYPAETQFIPPQELKESDIKMGLVYENDNSDVENLIPRESLRKNRNQTSYKKPGPPTPSKNGGRTNQTEHHETPRNILRESNDNGNSRRRSFTPKFLNNLFPIRGHATVTIPHDENITTTPRQNRLSSIRRRFSKSTQELGNTNSGFC